MTTVILAHRAEIYSGTDEEKIAAYFANRKAEHEELRARAKKMGLPPGPTWEELLKKADGN